MADAVPATDDPLRAAAGRTPDDRPQAGLSDEQLSAAQLRAKYGTGGGAKFSARPHDAPEAISDSVLRSAVARVLTKAAQRRGKAPLQKRVVRRLVEAQLGLPAKALDGRRKTMSRLVDGFRERLLVAVSQADATEVASLLRSRVNPNDPIRGVIPLHLAATKGQTHIANMLIEARAAPDEPMPSVKGWTPLIYASWKGNIELVRSLVTAGASANYSVADGSAALTWACIGGHVEIARSLIDARADTTIRDTKGVSLAEHARRAGHDAVVSVLEHAEERLAEEKSMAEFRARLQYPEGFEGSDDTDAKVRPQKPTHPPPTAAVMDAEAQQVRAATPAVSSSAGQDGFERLSATKAKIARWIRAAFWIESIGTFLAACLAMMYPAYVLGLCGILNAPSVAVDALPCLAIFVLLKGIAGVRRRGRLTRPMLEVWLLGDLLYLYAVINYAGKHPRAWTVWIAASLLVTGLIAPARVYWLLELRGYDSVQGEPKVKKTPVRSRIAPV